MYVNGSILVSCYLEQRKDCSELDRYSQWYLSGLSVCIRFSLYIIDCTVYDQNFIFRTFRFGGQNFAKKSLKFRVNQRKFTGIHVKCQSTFVRTKDEIRQTLLSLLLHSTVMDTIVTQSWCFKMAHGMLSSLDAIMTFKDGTDLELTHWPTTSFLDFSCLEHAQATQEHSRQPTTQLGSVYFIDANIR